VCNHYIKISLVPVTPHTHLKVVNDGSNLLSTLTTIFGFISFSTEMLRQSIIFDLRLPSQEVDENCALRGYYTACSGNSLLMFQDNHYVLSSGVKNRIQGFDSWHLKMGPIGFPETSVCIITPYYIIALKSTILISLCCSEHICSLMFSRTYPNKDHISYYW
jgi:hypothetical protein